MSNIESPAVTAPAVSATFKAIVNRKSLLAAVRLVGKVVAKSSPKPILTCLKLASSADGQSLLVSAADLRTSIVVRCHEIQLESAGAVLVNAAGLAKLLAAAQDDVLNLCVTQDGARMELRGNALASIATGGKPSDFPACPHYDTALTTATIPADELATLLARTLYVTAKERGRYAFKGVNGVMVSVNGNKMIMHATDGRRMVRASSTAATECRPEVKGILPADVGKVILDAIKYLGKGDAAEPVAFMIGENQFAFRIGNVDITSIAVKGQFPPCDDVIPKHHRIVITASRIDLLAALERMAAATDGPKGENKAVAFDVQPCHGLNLLHRSPENGDTQESFPCRVDGPALTIRFNPFFVMDALRSVPFDEVRLSLTAFNRPGLLEPVGASNWCYVTMPMNLE